MEFTTRFGLHSQATRLREERTPAGRGAVPACHRPWAEAPSEGLRPPATHRSLRSLPPAHLLSVCFSLWNYFFATLSVFPSSFISTLSLYLSVSVSVSVFVSVLFLVFLCL